MGRFRVIKSFLFLILFLPMVVMGAECTTFTDIGSSSYKSDILYASDKGWVSCKVGEFYPLGNVSRREAIKMALLAGGHNPPDSSAQCFDDIVDETWARKYICYAKDKGIITANASFRPNDEVSFQEASAMILNSMTSDSYTTTNDPDTWGNAYLEKMSYYGFTDDKLSKVERDYFTHILRAIESDPNKQPVVVAPKMDTITLSPTSIILGESIKVTVTLNTPLITGYSVNASYSKNDGTVGKVDLTCSGTTCSKSIIPDKVVDNKPMLISLYKDGSRLDSSNRYFSVKDVAPIIPLLDLIETTDVYPKVGVPDNNFTFIVKLKETLPYGHKIKYQLDYNQDGSFDDESNMKYLTPTNNPKYYIDTRTIKDIGIDRKVRFSIVDENENIVSEWEENSYTVGNSITTNNIELIDNPTCKNGVIGKIDKQLFPNLSSNFYKSPLNPFDSSLPVSTKNPQGYYLGKECTAFVHGRVYEKLNIDIPQSGNAQDWITHKGSNQTFTTKPFNNSIAVWGSGDFGHVAFVEKVENSYVYFNEANIETYSIYNTYNGKPSGGGYDGCLERLSISNFENKASGFKGYLYFSDIKDTNPTSTTNPSTDKPKYQFENFIISDKIIYRINNESFARGIRTNLSSKYDIRNLTDNKLYYQNLDISIHHKDGTYYKNCWAKNEFGVIEAKDIFSTDLQNCTVNELGKYLVVAKVLPLNTKNWIDSEKQWELEVKEDNRIDLGITVKEHSVTTADNNPISGNEFIFEVITDKELPFDYEMALVLEGDSEYDYLNRTFMGHEILNDGTHSYKFKRVIDKVGDNRRYKIKALHHDETLEDMLVEDTYDVKSFVDTVYPVETKYIGEEFNFKVKFKKEIHAEYNVSIQLYDGENIAVNKKMTTDDYITYKFDAVIRKPENNRKYTITIKKVQLDLFFNPEYDKHQAPVEVIEGVYNAKDIDVKVPKDITIKYDSGNSFAFTITPPNRNYNVLINNLDTISSLASNPNTGLYILNIEDACKVTSNLELEVKVDDKVLKIHPFYVKGTDDFTFGDLSGQFTEFVKPDGVFQVYLGENISELNQFQLCGGSGCQDLNFNPTNKMYEVNSSWFLNTAGLHNWHIKRISSTGCSDRELVSKEYSTIYTLNRDTFKVLRGSSTLTRNVNNLVTSFPLFLQLYNIGNREWTDYNLGCHIKDNEIASTAIEYANIGEVSETLFNVDIKSNLGYWNNLFVEYNLGHFKDKFLATCNLKNNSGNLVYDYLNFKDIPIDIRFFDHKEELRKLGRSDSEIYMGVVLSVLNKEYREKHKQVLIENIGTFAEDLDDLYALKPFDALVTKSKTIDMGSYTVHTENISANNYPIKVYSSFKLEDINFDTTLKFINDEIKETSQKVYYTPIYTIDNAKQMNLLLAYMNTIVHSRKSDYKTTLSKNYQIMSDKYTKGTNESILLGINDALSSELEEIEEGLDFSAAAMDLAYEILIKDLEDLYKMATGGIGDLEAKVTSIETNINNLNQLVGGIDLNNLASDIQINEDFLQNIISPDKSDFIKNAYDKVLGMEFSTNPDDINATYMMSFVATKVFLQASASKIVKSNILNKIQDLSANWLVKTGKVVFKPFKAASMLLKMKKIMRKLGKKKGKGFDELIDDLSKMTSRVNMISNIVKLENIEMEMTQEANVKTTRAKKTTASTLMTGDMIKTMFDTLKSDTLVSIKKEFIECDNQKPCPAIEYYDQLRIDYSTPGYYKNANPGSYNLNYNSIGQSRKTGYSGHHLIPSQLYKKESFLKDNYYFDDFKNVVYLPSTYPSECNNYNKNNLTEANRKKLKVCEKVLHNGQHLVFNEINKELLKDIKRIGKVILLREVSRVVLLNMGDVLRLNDGEKTVGRKSIVHGKTRVSKAMKRVRSNFGIAIIKKLYR